MLPVNRSVFIQVTSTKNVKHKEDLGSWRGSRFNGWRFAKVKWGNWYHHSRCVTSFPRTHSTYIHVFEKYRVDVSTAITIIWYGVPPFRKKTRLYSWPASHMFPGKSADEKKMAVHLLVIYFQYVEPNPPMSPWSSPWKVYTWTASVTGTVTDDNKPSVWKQFFKYLWFTSLGFLFGGGANVV